MIFSSEERLSDSPFVQTIWRTQSKRSGSFLSTAALHWEMVVMRRQGKTSITVRGPETKATSAHVPANAEWLGITFKLGSFMPQLPPGSILDRRDADLPEATGKSFWLYGSAWEYPTFENVDTFLLRLEREGLLKRDTVVDTVLRGYHKELSIRTVRRHFLHATGLTHGTIRQIERARCALILLQQGMPIAEVAYEAGYFDQPHMTRSLRRFVGQTPAQIVAMNEPEPVSVLYKTQPAR